MLPTLIKVVIAADWALVRAGIRYALATDPRVTVAAEAGTRRDAVELVLRLRPHVLVLGFRPAFPAAVHVARLLQKAGASTRVLLLVSQRDQMLIEGAVAAGITAFVPDSASVEEIVHAICSACSGNIVLPAVIAEAFLGRRGEPAGRRDPVVCLTPRELDVLRLAALGFRNQQIAQRLNLASRTVEGHLGRIRKRLNAETRVQALLTAASLGLIEISTPLAD